MTSARRLIPLLALLAAVCPGADEDMVRLQRDVAFLNEDVRALQRSMDERIGALTALLKQTLDRVNDLHRASAVTQTKLADGFKKVERPPAALTGRLDELVAKSLTTTEAFAGLNARLSGLEKKLADLDTALRVIAAPPPPPSDVAASGGTSGGRDRR